jgi:hypothetical protein
MHKELQTMDQEKDLLIPLWLINGAGVFSIPR